VKNFRYVEKTSAECNEDSYLAILHLLRVELHCKLQEKLHRVTWPLTQTFTLNLKHNHSPNPNQFKTFYSKIKSITFCDEYKVFSSKTTSTQQRE
jgi:hypothetical protein